MHYVKQFHINGVDTKQVACIELHGKPNAATEGYVGVLGIDVDSPLHDVYKCAAVNGSIYTWELLSSGLSIIVTDVVGSGAETVEFPYDTLKTPSLYVVKIGDSILDGEGYLYQVATIGASSCVATYCGIHVVKFGMSAYGLAVEQGFEGTLEEWLASLEASVYVRYSAYADGTDYTVEWSRGQRYIGVCCGHTPPVEKTDLVWSRFDAGVYIGSGEMPEWCDLQIDPDGEVTEIVQESGQSTTNVMSQKAVSNTFSNALTGSASGESVALNDVSPVAHEMGVSVRGKNLATAQQLHEGNTRYELTEFEGRTAVKFVDNKANSRAVVPFKPNTQYTVSFDARVVKYQDVNNRIRSCLFTFFYSDGTSNNFAKDRNEAWEHCTFTSTAGKTVVGVGNTSYDIVNFNYIDINSFQLEEGASETAYTPYIADTSGVDVLQYGKNLCNVASITGTENAAGDIKLSYLTKPGTYTASADVTLYADDTATNPTFSVQVLYTDGTHDSGANGSAVPKDGVTRRYTATVTTNPSKAIKWVRIISLNYSKQEGRNAKAENIQLEYGATATEYTPYVEPVSFDATKPISPSMTLTTDTAGAIMDVTYNRDANKVLQEILSRLSAVEAAVLS